MEKNTGIVLVIIVLIIAVISLINYVKNNNNIDEETAKCIASKSKLFVSKTCSHCEQQKRILGDYLNLFNLVDCIDNSKECQENNILRIPTWIIDSKKYVGVKSLKELKNLADC